MRKNRPTNTALHMMLLSLGTLSLSSASHVAPRSPTLATRPRAAVISMMVAAERATSAKDELLSLSLDGLKLNEGAASPSRTSAVARPRAQP